MKVTYEGVEYDCDDAFSGRDFTQRTLDAFDLSGRVIYASCFAQERPDTIVFDASLSAATFIRCNLTNVHVPIGNTLIDCITTRALVQNDGRDWELDDSDRPVRVTSEKYWLQQRTSVDPADIPASKIVLAENETLESRLAAEQATREGR